MSLSDLSIRRPVFAIVLSLLIILFGLAGFNFLGVREYPAVDPPVVTVTTTYSGASPDVISSQITEPIERVINGISGIKTVSSTSRDEQSQITIEFTLETDLDTAANDVRDKVAQAVRLLPVDANPPVVEKADANADPIIFLALTSETRSVLDLSDIADRTIRERLETIPGVSAIRIFGEKRYAMRLWMDPVKLAVHQITPLDVQNALEAQNVDLPSGRIEGDTREISLRTAGRLVTPEDFDNMIVRQDKESGRQLLFRDIGYAEVGAENPRAGLKERGVPTIGVAVIPQPNTNAIAIADEFYKRFAQIKKELPPEIKADIGFDYTTYVRRSVVEVEETLLIAFGLVALIIFLFLRDLRSTLVPVIAIPISVVAGFFIMYVAGFSINILTLVAIVLAIGLVCDDAIVVLENIYTKVEEGMTPFKAALVGSKEIYFAVISTTVTLAAVFLPVIFLSGLTGRLFREFGVTLAGCVLVSAFVALTLSPMMCRFLLRSHGGPGSKHKGGWFHRVTEPFFVGLGNIYRASLALFLRHRWLVLPVLLVNAALIYVVGSRLPRELAPLEDRSNIRINIIAPEGATYEYTSGWLDQIAEYVSTEVPGLQRTFSIIGLQGSGPSGGTQNVFLKDSHEREKTQQQVFQQLSKDLPQFTGIRAIPTQPPTIGARTAGQPVRYVLQAPTLEKLTEILPLFLAEAGAHPDLRTVDADLKVNRPEGSIAIDRRKAASLGISVQDIARTLQLAYGGQRFGYFLQRGKQYQVIGQMARDDRNDPGDIKKLFVRARDGSMVSLDNLLTFSEGASPAAIYRFNRAVSATISCTPAEGKTIGDGIAALDAISAKILPPDFRTALTGQARDFAESNSSLLFAFAFALLLIYLVLAAQFESFADPFTILLTVPMSLAGALLSLWATGSTLNIFSQIGIIMLVGLVTKNGILIVEFANQRREAGLDKLAAVLDAAVARLRPILMTSLATILGILPIALSLGTASGSRQSLGIAVVGGLIFSGILTLYIVPAVYTYLSFHRASHEEEL